MNIKVSDMNKKYIINFLQEYSFYIKQCRVSGSMSKVNDKFELDIMCPTEFFESTYIAILKETEEYSAAFGREPDDIIDKINNIGTLLNEDFELFYDGSWIPEHDSMEATQDNINKIIDYAKELKEL